MKITDIYEEYKNTPMLAMHQIRTAAVALMICDSLSLETDKENIVKACLIHDIGNVIKFDLKQTKSIFGLSDSEIIEIKEIQDEFIQKYGLNEHEATGAIAMELGVSSIIIDLISENRFINLCTNRHGNDLSLKILQYSDSRVCTHGILSYDDRMKDADHRYANHKNSIEEEKRYKLVECGKEIEKQIFSHSKIKPEDITDESARDYIEKVKNFEM